MNDFNEYWKEEHGHNGKDVFFRDPVGFYSDSFDIANNDGNIYEQHTDYIEQKDDYNDQEKIEAIKGLKDNGAIIVNAHANILLIWKIDPDPNGILFANRFSNGDTFIIIDDRNNCIHKIEKHKHIVF